VDIRAVPDCLFHSIGEIPERTEDAFVRYRDAWSDAWLANDYIDVLRLETAQNRLLTTTSE
jgi:hypothetical protein